MIIHFYNLFFWVASQRISAEDMPPIPLYVGRGGASLLGGEWFLKDEYDPSYPNEYERLVKQLRRESRKEKRSSASTESNSTNAMLVSLLNDSSDLINVADSIKKRDFIKFSLNKWNHC